MNPPQLQIRLLGPLQVLVGGERIDLPPSKKARALLAYLVATGRPHSRSALCDLFWQDVNDPRAGLRWALSKLRGVVDQDEHCCIVTRRGRVGFDPGSADVDFHRVQAELADGPTAASTAALERAASAFNGEFVEGLDLSGCHQYEAWCLGTREQLRSLHLSIHSTLCERFRDDPEAALPHALSRLNLDPFSEDAYIAVIEPLARMGRVDKGLEFYDRCCRMLSDHLGASPSEALEAARRRLRSGVSPSAPPPSSPTDGSGPALDGMDSGVDSATLAEALSRLPLPRHLPAPTGDEPRLVGRDEAIEAFTRTIDRSASDETGSVVLVTGEAGIGKTRLLREMVGRVRQSGGCVLSGPIFETEEVRPYGPWADLLRQLPPEALDREIRKGLSGLLEAPGSEPRSDGPAERSQLFDAAGHLLASMAEVRAPVLLVLDDVHWLDASSAALLHYLARTLASSPLVFALTAREEEIDPGSPVARVIRSLEGTGLLCRIPLRRLDASDTGDLVRSVAAEMDPHRVFERSEGNPFFTLAVAASVRESFDEVPATIEGELADRLDRLDSGSLSILPWIAALGRGFDLPTLMQVVDRSPHMVVDAIDSLERKGILRATDEDRYDFTHSLLRQAAYRRPSEPVRRVIHRSIARGLDAVSSTDGRAPSAVAHHAELGGLPALAARSCVEAAENSLWVFAYEEAAELVRRGLAQVEKLPDETRIPLEMDLLRIYSFRGLRGRRPDDVEARVQRVTEEARARALTQVVAAGHALLMELQYQRGAFDEAHQSSLRYADAGRKDEPSSAIRALSETAACLLLLDQAPDDARRLATEAFKLADDHHLELDVVSLTGALLAHRDGDLDAAGQAFEDVIRLGRKARDRWWERPAMTRMIMVDLDRGDPSGALERARSTQRLAERMGDAAEEAFARGLGAIAVLLKSDDSESAAAESGLEAVDDALVRLRELDTLWRIAHVQAYAAEVELQMGRADSARRRVTELMEAARALDRPGLKALARALLAHASVAEGDHASARRHLSAPEITSPIHRLPHRALTVIERARDLTREMDDT